jgi:site-specific DNA-methyltransferase (adenine-specific)
MEEFIDECCIDLDLIIHEWKKNINISEGKMRSIRGSDIENFVLDTVNKIGLACDTKLYAKNGNKDQKILENGSVSKKHKLDIHIYKNDIFDSVIECKSYLDSCYYSRACHDFKIFDKFGYNLKYYIFSLEDSINDETKLFTDIIYDNICNDIFFCVDGKRSSRKPLFKQTANCNRQAISRFVKTFWEEKIQNFNIIPEDIKLLNGDCVELMPKIPDKSIDMILCDLPYQMTKNKWDTLIPFDILWENYTRIIKDNGAIVLFGSEPFTSKLINSNLKMFRYSLIWEKNKFSDFLNSKRKPMKIHEDICVFYKKQPTYNPQYWYSTPYTRWNKQEAVDKQTNYNQHKQNISSSSGKRLPTTVLKFNRVERPKHPTQKPVELLEWLIKTYTNEDETVLDNCMGVGSTSIACLNTKRKFIGIELDDNYFNTSIEILNNNPIFTNIYR